MLQDHQTFYSTKAVIKQWLNFFHAQYQEKHHVITLVKKVGLLGKINNENFAIAYIGQLTKPPRIMY